jgi:hypothetical protein
VKENIRDREHDKFREASQGRSKVAVVIEQTSPIPVDTEGIEWDTLEASYPINTQEVYDFFKESVLVQKITINYTNASKERLQSVTKVIYVL